ncbi:WD40-repeat-containing domain protein [Gorgonomyces haynaldii]|nr:WD40-repeat-containing domain protein [Gorgonomyces haynaldii]
MSQELFLKTHYEPAQTIESIYTGGKACVVDNYLLTTSGQDVCFQNLETGEKRKITSESDTVTCFAVSPDREMVAIAYQSQQLRIYSWDGTLLKSFKAHQAPVLAMDFDSTSTLVATGSADSTVKVWDCRQGHITHNFKGHGGVISCVKFQPNTLKLASGSDDCKVRLWDLNERKCIRVFDAHVSVIKGLDFSEDGYLYSGARDQVFIKWDLDEDEPVLTVPIYETVEDLVLVQLEDETLVCTCGSEAVLKLWNEDGKLVLESQKDEHNHEMVQMSYMNDKNQIAVFTSDQNILIYSLGQQIQRIRQFAGYNQEILDLQLVGDHHLAVVTNSEQLRVYDLATLDCEIIYGHTDIVLAASASKDGKTLVSGSKDATVKVWRKNDQFELVETFKGHTGPVSAVAVSEKYFITASHDRTIKKWDFKKAQFTIVGHDKDIQSLDIAPNDKLFCSAGLDKLAKLWSVNDGSLLGTFKGHKRGIWQVKFSPIDQLIATCSTDKTIKLWNLNDFSCTRTLEGHLNTVLNLSFMTAGLQLVSSGSDGLVKVWNIKDSECVATLDNHEDRIWGLAINKTEEYVISGSSDSTITIWQDKTLQVKEQREQEEEDKIVKQNDLQLFLQRKDYKSALILAMHLGHPIKLLEIFQTVHVAFEEIDSISGSSQIDDYVSNLETSDLEKLLLYIRDWNTQQRHAPISQMLVHLILKSYSQEDLFKLPKAKEILDSLMTYTQRHFEHAQEMLKQTHLISFTLQSMQ